MPDENTEVCIVGAGAAGLWAAAACAKQRVSTLVLEKTRRTGTKILSSGGSRCNLTTMLGPSEAAKHFGAGKNFIKPAFQALPPRAARAHFESLGVRTKEEPEFDKVFPASDSAREVRDALLDDALRAGAKIRLETPVSGVEQTEDGWAVHVPGGRVLCRKLLICTGGKSYPKSGTTGDAYPWFSSLGLKLVDPVPALVPLTSPAPWVHELSGIAVDGELCIGARRRLRPVLFTHKGISGPAAMDLSEEVTRGGSREARLDLLPEMTQDALRALLKDAAGQPGSPKLRTLLPLPRRIIETVATLAGLPEANPAANQINKAARNKLVALFKGLPIPISGSLGFAKAEVTSGGLDLGEVERRTMEVKRFPGLYVFGEALDLAGPIGGFSFQAAFSTAELAARSACAEFGRS